MEETHIISAHVSLGKASLKALPSLKGAALQTLMELQGGESKSPGTLPPRVPSLLLNFYAEHRLGKAAENDVHEGQGDTSKQPREVLL